jgi:hypothetical protein
VREFEREFVRGPETRGVSHRLSGYTRDPSPETLVPEQLRQTLSQRDISPHSQR